MQFSNLIGNVEVKGDKSAGVVHVTEQCKRRSVRDMADMFQQITDEKIQKFKQREIILGRKENQQSSKEISSGSVPTNEFPSNNDQHLPPPVPSKLTPPPLPSKLTPPPPLPPLPSKQTSETKKKSPAVSKIPVLVSIKPLEGQVPASPLPLPMILDMTVTSGPIPGTGELLPISVDMEEGPVAAPQSHHTVN